MKSVLVSVAVLFVLTSPLSAQWTKDTSRKIPMTRDGKPNLSAPVPKAPDGKPDLSGVWFHDIDPNGKPAGVEQMVFSQYFVNVAADMKMEDVPFQPWAKELFFERLKSDGRESPATHCKPSSITVLNSVPIPHKIVQTPQLVLILYEENTVFRQIFLDGRQPAKDAEPRYMGYSTGKWVGDTLVVETVGFNDKGWLDAMGHPHSDALRLTERIRRRDFGHLDIETTINDPKAYTKPITYTQKTTLMAEDDLLEYFCSDNEKDVQHFK